MKKTVLFLIFTISLFSITLNAQPKTWNFSDTATWPTSAGIGTNPIIVDKLGLYPITTNTNFGAVNANVTTFPDGFVSVNRFQVNGGGGVTAPTYMPTQRYFFIDVDGPCTLKIWAKSGSNSSARNIFVTNGTALLGTVACTIATTADNVIGTVNITAAGRIYVYCDSACNFYKMEITGANVTTNSLTLATNDFNKLKNGSIIFSDRNQVYIKNIKSSTKVEIYNTNGNLLKSVNTNSDTNYSLSPGVYIINTSSSKGNSSQKVIIK